MNKKFSQVSLLAALLLALSLTIAPGFASAKDAQNSKHQLPKIEEVGSGGQVVASNKYVIGKPTKPGEIAPRYSTGYGDAETYIYQRTACNGHAAYGKTYTQVDDYVDYTPGSDGTFLWNGYVQDQGYIETGVSATWVSGSFCAPSASDWQEKSIHYVYFTNQGLNHTLETSPSDFVFQHF